MNYQLLLYKAEDFVKKYVSEHDNPHLLYHNLATTQLIASVAGEISKQYQLTEEDYFILNTAAWSLHLGYYKDILHNEQASVQLAEEFCKSCEVEDSVFSSVRNCILAAKHLQSADTDLAKILCDADSFYLGAENFSDYNKLRRKEYELLNNVKVDKAEWTKKTIKLLEGHQYYSAYAKEFLNKTKTVNLQKLWQKDSLQKVPVDPVVSPVTVESDDDETKKDENKKEKKNKDKDKKDKKESADKTIETMFRTTSANSQRLSSQADTKAHIMISVNSIIISVLLSLVVRKMDEFSALTVPIVMLLLVNLVTIIFAILATRPNVPKGLFSLHDLKLNKVNLLFFGNFFKMNFSDYSESMLKVMDDRQSLYLVLLRNLYEQGIVLARKYKLLKKAYNIFMYGFIISVVAFFIASKFFPDK
jgi:predicted metal-dependent HD superfamily phosphohydrolase